MTHANRRTLATERKMGLGLLALLLVPLLLILHAPVLAAVVPGALLTVASWAALEGGEQPALGEARVVGGEDHEDLRRVASATPIDARTRRVG